MRRIVAMFKRDLLSTTKDYLLVYALVAPVIMALGFRFFLPAVGQIALNAVVTRELEPALVEGLQRYLNVEVVEDRAALERRVLAFDDAVGIIADGAGSFTLVTEGNEAEESVTLPKLILTKLIGGGAFTYAEEDLRGPQTPLREIAGAFMALAAAFIAAMVMGFHIIEEKESRMMAALGVSPLSRREYIASRSVTVALISVALVFATLWTMGLTAFNHGQMLAVALVTSLLAMLLGFLIGALSPNQIAGVANVKFGVLLVMVPAFLALLVPEAFHWTLYWVPSYWAFISLHDLLTSSVTWAIMAPRLLWNLVTSLALIGIAYPFLRNRLDFARE